MMIVTCEHAVNTVPGPYRDLFSGKTELLDSHSAWDPGASELARAISKHSGAHLHEGGVTRLLVDLNRSIDNAKGLFSPLIRKLSPAEKEEIVSRYYRPFRQEIEESVGECVKRGEKVLHVSVHTFTPVLKEKIRKCDIGLLYDTERPEERVFALEVRKRLHSEKKDFFVRLNYPYHGRTDGHTAYMRGLFSQQFYIGLEVEVNQAIYYQRGQRWERLKKILAGALCGHDTGSAF